MDFSQVPHDETVSEEETIRPDPPEMVPGRILHIDADFTAYQHGYRWEDEDLARSIEMLEVSLNTLRIMAGAEHAKLHLTMGKKGGRYELARVEEYQAQRSKKDPGLVQRVAELRQHMADMFSPTITGFAQYEQEADDSLTQAMWNAHKTDEPHLHVLWSLDKDLWMVGGLHMDDYELIAYPWGVGSCEYDSEKKKIVGCGTSFFWHQLLMGDTADNIPGLPMLSREDVLEFLPKPKYYTDAHARKAKNAAQKLQKAKAVKAAEEKIKAKKLGPVAAGQILADCTTDADYLRRVHQCYTNHYGKEVIFNAWDGQSVTCTVGDMLLEQARLLWMRRTVGEDVLQFFTEVMQQESGDAQEQSQ